MLPTHDLDVALHFEGVLETHVDHAVRVLDFVRHLKRLVFLWPVVELKLIILVDSLMFIFFQIAQNYNQYLEEM